MKVTLRKKREEILQTWSVSEIVEKHPPYGGWETLFQSYKNEFEDLDKVLMKEEANYGNYFPLKKNLFRAFELTSLNNVKVVILGQDPYHQIKSDGYPRAQGLSFSVSDDDVIPSSLCNIFKELEREYENFSYSSGNLEKWARQGVLLLNSCLTVRPSSPGKHEEIWNFLIIAVFEEIAKVNKNCVYVLWGKYAQNYEKYISGNPPILKAVHPSGMNMNNPNIKEPFLGCNHFIKINEFLKKNGLKEIDWNL